MSNLELINAENTNKKEDMGDIIIDEFCTKVSYNGEPGDIIWSGKDILSMDINLENILRKWKEEQKKYTRYSGYPGGLKTQILAKVMQSTPERVFHHAVKGMLPKNRLGRQMVKKLKIYTGPNHPHDAQKPENLPDNLRRL